MFDAIFTIILVLLALDHLVTGSLGVFAPTLAGKMYNHFFGVAIPHEEQYEILFRPWGALGMFAGVVGILPVFDVERYIMVLYALLFLLLLRIWMRTQYAKDAEKYLHMSYKRNVIHIAIIAACAAIIGIKLFQLW